MCKYQDLSLSIRYRRMFSIFESAIGRFYGAEIGCVFINNYLKMINIFILYSETAHLKSKFGRKLIVFLYDLTVSLTNTMMVIFLKKYSSNESTMPVKIWNFESLFLLSNLENNRLNESIVILRVSKKKYVRSI